MSTLTLTIKYVSSVIGEWCNIASYHITPRGTIYIRLKPIQTRWYSVCSRIFQGGGIESKGIEINILTYLKAGAEIAGISSGKIYVWKHISNKCCLFGNSYRLCDIVLSTGVYVWKHNPNLVCCGPVQESRLVINFLNVFL